MKGEHFMSKTKLFTGVLLVLAVLFSQVGTVFAAPDAQDTTTITGTVTSIVPETDANGVTTVLVTLVDGAGQTQTVRINLDAAVTLGLVTVDPTTQAATAVDPATLTAPVTIDSTAVIPDAEVDVHPIAAILASFFGMDPVAVNDLHTEGFGFGVIAQALWMQKNLGDDAVTAEIILQAKENHDFSTVTLPDGSHPGNWGQFRKALLDKKNNLGTIVSGHAENGTTEESTLTQQTSSEQGKGKAKNQGKGKGHNKNP
jgi:hypothetical protein